MFNSLSSWCSTSCNLGPVGRYFRIGAANHYEDDYLWRAGTRDLPPSTSLNTNQHIQYETQDRAVQDPFSNIAKNDYSRKSMRRKSSSDSTAASDYSSVGKNSLYNYRVPKHKKGLAQTNTVPTPSFYTISQQPRGYKGTSQYSESSEKMFRPDVTNSDNDSPKIDPRTKLTYLQPLSGIRRTQSLSPFMTPDEARIPPQERRRIISRGNSTMADLDSITREQASKSLQFSLLSRSLVPNSDEKTVEKQKGLPVEKQKSLPGENKKNPFANMARTVIATNKMSMKNKVPSEIKVVDNYIFGYVSFLYKFTKSKKLQVDVLRVTDLPKYNHIQSVNSKSASLTYVDVDVNVKDSSNKILRNLNHQLSHVIKKFRSGYVQYNEEDFDPECTFKSKHFASSILLISVFRRGYSRSNPNAAIGHAILPITPMEIRSDQIIHKTLPLKNGTENQSVKGHMLINLKCEPPTMHGNFEINLTVKKLQHLNQSSLGRTSGFIGKVKIKAQVIKEEKISNTFESSWMDLKNNSSRENEKHDFEGLGLLLNSKNGNSAFNVRERMYEDEIWKFGTFFVFQIIGRNNTPTSAHKDIQMGSVVIGPEMRSSDVVATENTTHSTHWGRALENRGKEVEVLHSLHL